MANKLPHSKRVQSLNRLNEGMSLRAISRLQDMSINTVTKRFVDAGETCLDLKRRLVGRVQLTADGHVAYPGAVAAGFGKNVDFAQLIKTYGEDPSRGPERKYSPPGLPGAPKVPVIGNPDPAHISTSYVELANLTMQMGMRRHRRSCCTRNSSSSQASANHNMPALETHGNGPKGATSRKAR